jgi:predicted N-formylglutamate amidohydrolase
LLLLLFLMLLLLLLLLVFASVAPYAAVAADATSIHVIIAAALGYGSRYRRLKNSWQPFHRLVHAALTETAACSC